MKLENQRILITGGSAGIGLELARALSGNGNKIAIVGRNEERLAAVAQELPVETFARDLSDIGELDALADQAAERLGGLSLLINNAGIQHNYKIAETSAADVARMAADEIGTNLTSVIALTAYCLPHLERSGHAAIVNVTSGLSLQPKTDAPVYCATKAALHNHSQVLRYQLEDAGSSVRVIEVVPPLVDTGMTAGRGSGKMAPADVAAEAIAGIEADKDQVFVGKAKLLRTVNRIAPGIAARIMRKM